MTDTRVAVQSADLASAERQQKVEAKPSDVAMMRTIRAKTGKSGFAQQMETWRLGRGPGRITFADYFAYRLYDDQLYKPMQRWNSSPK